MRTALLALPVAIFLAGHAAAQETAPLEGLAGEVACAPVAPAVDTPAEPTTAIHILPGGLAGRTLFGTGDTVLIGAGAEQTLQPGNTFYVRRLVRDRFAAADGIVPDTTIHPAGVVRITSVGPAASLGVVTFACDGIAAGDYLDRFAAPVVAAAAGGSAPDYARPARVLLGAERQRTGASGDFMIVDQGAREGLQPGQQVTIFRPAPAAEPRTSLPVGTATVHLVQPGTATIRIDRSVDAVYVGDLVAVHR